MKAVAVTPAHTLEDIELPAPQPGARDLLVRVDAVSVNPVDFKQREAAPPADGSPHLLGWDVAGTVTGIGRHVRRFRPGDRVFYAGCITRPGANSEFHVVDERIAAHAPSTLDQAAAAALPLTSITAWEALFTRLGIATDGSDRGRTILIVGGAGGVGSIAIQLARRLAGLTVIATASRPESAQWCRELGADGVIDHSAPMPEQLAAIGKEVDFVLCTSDLAAHFRALAALVAPQGRICSIVRSEAPLEVDLLFAKSATLVFELMFTRPMFATTDMDAQHHLLEQVAGMVDGGRLRTTLARTLGPINAANLGLAHAALESRRTIGKLVLAGFGD